MKYIVETKYIIGKENEYIYEVFSKTFSEDPPIVSRQLAFDYFASVQDSFETGGEDPRKLFNDEGKYEIKLENELHEVYKEPQAGIFLYFEEPEKERKLIHFVGFQRPHIYDEIIFNLEEEYKIYSNNHYGKDNFDILVEYYCIGEWEDGYTEDEPSSYNILKSPINWQDKKEELWWSDVPKIQQEENIPPANISIENLITRGEGPQIEFKPSLLYNFNTGLAGISVKEKIARNIVAFLNSEGGFLFIGISDDGRPQGINYDFSLSKGKSPKDFFQLEFDDMISQFLSFTEKTWIHADFFDYSGKVIYVIKVSKSQYPIFLKNREEKKFIIRAQASTREIKDVEEIVKYCISHWRK